MLAIQDISTMTTTEWDGFIDRHPVSTLFHKSSWLQVLAETQPSILKKVGFFEDGNLIGVLPYYVKRVWPLRVAASPFVVEDTPYLGLVIDESRFNEALDLLGIFMKQNGINYFRIIQRQAVPVLKPASGYALTEKHTHLLSLAQSEDEIWKSMEGRCRTAVRKAEKGGVVVRRETLRENISGYYAILDNLYAGQKMATPNIGKFYYLLWDALVDKHLHMMTAWLGETMIAGAIIIQDKDRCYYLNGCSRSDYNSLCPNNLIQWEAIRLAKSLGSLWYDFVGSDIERLAKFKKSFGGELVTYSCLEKSSAPWVTFVRQRYPQFKAVMGRIKNRLRRS